MQIILSFHLYQSISILFIKILWGFVLQFGKEKLYLPDIFELLWREEWGPAVARIILPEDSLPGKGDPEVDQKSPERFWDSLGVTELPRWPDVNVWHRARKEAFSSMLPGPQHCSENLVSTSFGFSTTTGFSCRALAAPCLPHAGGVSRDKGEPGVGEKNGGCLTLTAPDSLACGHVRGHLSETTERVQKRPMSGNQTSVGLVYYNFFEN